MNVHERIWKQLNHEETDRVPTFSQSIETPFLERYDEEFGVPEAIFDTCFPKLPIDMVFAKAIGFDSKWFHLGGIDAPSPSSRDKPDVPGLEKGQSVNSSGQVYMRNSSGENWYYDGALKTPELLEEWISYINDFTTRDESYFKDFASIYEFGKEKDILPIPTIGGPTYTTWSAIGMDKFSYMIRKYPRLVRGLVDAWTDKTIDAHAALFEQGVDMCFICDDFAQKDRLMFHPRHFNEFIVPNYKRLAKNAHKHGAKFLVHTDGNILNAFPGMVEAGVDAAEPLEYESGMRLKDLKEKFGNQICLIGNVPASDALCVGDVEFTIEITKRCIQDAARGGGFILSPGANVLATTKPRNLRAMIETVKKYGAYPIKNA
ncbi:MAG: uroporphyrinogen decarboxylase family protein [Promethearchaeota archaeon]